MKHRYLHKALSLAASFLLCSTTVQMPVKTVSALPDITESAEPVPMIVLLDDGPDAAAERAEQDRVFEEIRELYPQAEMRFRYTNLLNGFSCTFPESCTNAVRSIPDVAATERCKTVTIEPQLANAAALGSVPAFYNETGCTGEGKVICIIDTELDLSHPMFAPLANDIETKIKKEDIVNICNTIGFSRRINPDHVYINSKVPFAADYLESDTYAVANENESAYHGTHVAGIAAGNEYTDADGNTFSGIAKDAQIIFMAIDNYLTPDEDYFYTHKSEFTDRYLYDCLIAALDDAAALHADAVNMSFGYSTPDDFLSEDSSLIRAFKAAENAGMTICISAANSGAESKTMLNAENPYHAMLNSFACENSGTLIVASAENNTELDAGVMLLHGEQILYNSSYPGSEAAEPLFLSDVLPPGEYEYVDCGRGYAEDFEGKDLTGKIALIQRDTQYFDFMGELAHAAGAAGVIVINKSNDIRLFMLGNKQIPMALISSSDGAKLKQADTKKITLTQEHTVLSLPSIVSEYSSWGAAPSLELRPDIMGIGGSVESAAYGNNSMILSGTSMASPYLAGCAMLLSEYLDQNGCALTGSERQKYMRNLLMTGAVPYQENGLYVSPRRQGAGLVSMENAIHTKVILTGAEGESKISLRDGLGTSFSFPVTVTNISEEDVSFASARIELTTDTAKDMAGDEIFPPCKKLDGTQALHCTADCGTLTQIAAGETKTVTVSVSLDPAQAAEILADFCYGFYIEGYLLLEGAGNNIDISVPLLGYSNLIADIPLVTELHSGVSDGLSERKSTKSLLEYAEDVQEVCERQMTEKQLEYLDLYYANYGTMCSPSLEDLNAEIRNRLYEPEFTDARNGLDDIVRQLMRMNTAASDTVCPAYVSPDTNGHADFPAIFFTQVRPFRSCGMRIRNENGDIVLSSDRYKNDFILDEFYFHRGFFAKYPMDTYPEGQYTFEVDIESTDASYTKETLQTPFIIDLTKPEVKTTEETVDGRRLLHVTATDKNLDGFVICGNSKEGKEPQYGRTPLYYLQKEQYLSTDGSDYGGPDWMQYNDPIENPPLSRLLIGNGEIGVAYKWVDQFDFFDFQRAEPDENGACTITYDITDLEGYSINVLDRALNITEIEKNTVDIGVRSVDILNPYECPLKPGVYQANNAMIEITEDSFYILPFRDITDAKRMPYRYEYEYNYWLTPREQMKLILTDTTYNIEYQLLIAKAEDGSLQLLNIPFIYGSGFLDAETLIPTDLISADDYLAIGIDEAEEQFVAPYMAGRSGKDIPDYVNRDVLPEGIVEYHYIYDEPYTVYTVTVDLKTGIARLSDGTETQLAVKEKGKRGDVDCSGRVDVADAVLLARFLAEDQSAVIARQGSVNADCNLDGNVDHTDVRSILRYIANLFHF